MSIAQKPARIIFRNLLAAAAFCPLLVLAMPALAGFEWTPPPQARKMMPPVAAAPAMDVEKEPLGGAAPEIIPFPMMETIDGVPQESMMADSPFDHGGDDFAGDAAKAQEISPFDDPQDLPAAQPRRRPFGDDGRPMSTTAPELQNNLEMMMKAPPVAMQPAPAPAPVTAIPVAPAAPVQIFAAVDGFGSDIPLVLAMRQIVPAGYAFAFDPGINQGARISWSGGAPWNEVLDAALRPLGLAGVVTDNSVWIRRIVDAGSFMPVQAGNESVILPEPMGAPIVSPQLVAPVIDPLPAEDRQRMAAPVAEPLPAAIDAAGNFMPPQSYPRRQNPKRSAAFDDGAPIDTASQYSGGRLVYAAPAPVFAPVAPAVPPSPATPVAATPFAAAPTPITPGSPFAASPVAPFPAASYPAAPSVAAPVAAFPAPAALAYGAAAMDPLEIRFWNAPQGVSLKQVLQQWTSSANVALLWNSPFDYVLPVPVALHGTFPDAVTGLLTAYNLSDPRPLGRLHPNLPQGPSVLVIENWTTATN